MSDEPLARERGGAAVAWPLAASAQQADAARIGRGEEYQLHLPMGKR